MGHGLKLEDHEAAQEEPRLTSSRFNNPEAVVVVVVEPDKKAMR
jgi:hypothetical protein